MNDDMNMTPADAGEIRNEPVEATVWRDTALDLQCFIVEAYNAEIAALTLASQDASEIERFVLAREGRRLDSMVQRLERLIDDV